MLYHFIIVLEQRTERSRMVWVELYWAEDGEHAEEQAQDANPRAKILHVAIIPDAERPA